MHFFSDNWYGGMDGMPPRIFDGILDQIDLKASRMNNTTTFQRPAEKTYGGGSTSMERLTPRGGKSSIRKERLTEVYHAFDIDGQGTVDRNELLALGRCFVWFHSFVCAVVVPTSRVYHVCYV